MQSPSPLTFYPLRDERDYPLLLDLNHRSHAADGSPARVTLEEIAHTLAHMDGLTPQEGVIFAELERAPVGYSRLGWYSSRADTRLYYQVSFLDGAARGGDAWAEMVAENERRLRLVAAAHTGIPNRYLQAWAAQEQKDWMAVLERCGYRVARRFNNMLYPLGQPPDAPLPAGFELRPVRPEHLRAIWEAQKEMNAGLFENVAEDWLDEKFPAWRDAPENDPRFWQVAWAGEHIAGMVLAHADDADNAATGRRHGYTEHIYVRAPWRGRGLASALIASGLRALKAHGITVAELGVDSENESAAFRLYQSLGYRTYSVDTWYRKEID